MTIYTGGAFIDEFVTPLFSQDYLNVIFELRGAEVICAGPRDVEGLWLKHRDMMKVYPIRRNGTVAFIASQLAPTGSPAPSLALGTGVGERWGLWPIYGEYSTDDLSGLTAKFQTDLSQPIPVPGNTWRLLRSTTVKHRPHLLARALKVTWNASNAGEEDVEQLDYEEVEMA